MHVNDLFYQTFSTVLKASGKTKYLQLFEIQNNYLVFDL